MYSMFVYVYTTQVHAHIFTTTYIFLLEISFLFVQNKNVVQVVHAVFGIVVVLVMIVSDVFTVL